MNFSVKRPNLQELTPAGELPYILYFQTFQHRFGGQYCIYILLLLLEGGVFFMFAASHVFLSLFAVVVLLDLQGNL